MFFVWRITKHLLYRVPLVAARVDSSVCFFVINLFSHSNKVVQRTLIVKEGVNHTSWPPLITPLHLRLFYATWFRHCLTKPSFISWKKWFKVRIHLVRQTHTRAQAHTHLINLYFLFCNMFETKWIARGESQIDFLTLVGWRENKFNILNCFNSYKLSSWCSSYV